MLEPEPAESEPEPAAPEPEPAAELHRRIVEAQLATVRQRIRRARRHAGRAKPKKPRKKARASLAALRDRLVRVEKRTRGGDLTEAGWFRIRRVLEAIEHRLDRFLGRKPKRARLAKLRRQVDRASRSLRG